jgi:hypothetical protein
MFLRANRHNMQPNAQSTCTCVCDKQDYKYPCHVAVRALSYLFGRCACLLLLLHQHRVLLAISRAAGTTHKAADND